MLSNMMALLLILLCVCGSRIHQSNMNGHWGAIKNALHVFAMSSLEGCKLIEEVTYVITDSAISIRDHRLSNIRDVLDSEQTPQSIRNPCSETYVISLTQQVSADAIRLVG